MATYKEISNYVHEKFGYTPKTCWIAHVKELCGVPISPAPNRISPTERARPCPEEKRPQIEAALRNFGIIP